MASCPSDVPCIFLGICEDNFYFQVLDDEPDLQSDTFRKADTTSSLHLLRVKDNLFLTTASHQVHLEDLTREERGPDCKFIIQPFHEIPDGPDDPPSGEKGRPVTLAVKVEDKFSVVSCGEECTIKVQTMDKLPETIEDKDCHSLFYMQSNESSDDKYMFQSAAHMTFYLAAERAPEKECGHKLVLRKFQNDTVDEGCLIKVTCE